jgi:hypothetical protein
VFGLVYPSYPVPVLLPLLACPYCRISSFLSCSVLPVQSVLFRISSPNSSVRFIISPLFWISYPVPAVIFWLSRPLCPVSAVLFQFRIPYVPFPAVLSLPSRMFSFFTILSYISSSESPVLDVRPRMSRLGCDVPDVQSHLSDTDCPAELSCAGCPVTAILAVLQKLIPWIDNKCKKALPGTLSRNMKFRVGSGSILKCYGSVKLYVMEGSLVLVKDTLSSFA